jgi:EAL domain-containing protein (putative c-di-GMP-specific phosphodiesterase class I)
MSDSTLLDRVLAPGGISAVFQPIVETRGGRTQTYALECLTRGPAGTFVEAPGVLFEYVRRKGEEASVDRACIAVALREAAALPDALRLCLNVHASTLSRDVAFPAFVRDAAESHGICPARLTIEIVEHAPPHDGPAFVRAIAQLRTFSMRIALDDVGLGHSNFKMIVDTRPDYFKIDRYFVRAVQDDPYRLAVLDSLARLAEKVGARVVAEGVEELAELDACQGLGIDLIQGFLFSRPLSASAARAHCLLALPARPQLDTAGGLR